MRALFVIFLGLFLFGCQTGIQSEVKQEVEAIQPALGTWRVVLQSPGGDLPFRLELSKNGTDFAAVGYNAEESVRFDSFTHSQDGSVTFSIDHYESIFRGKLDTQGTSITGEWTKVVGPNKLSRLPFTAQHDETRRFIPSSGARPANFAGKWAVTFSEEDGTTSEAVADFSQDGSVVTGTFLTPVGDYRFLEGIADGKQMALSCFDGGHAFLFKATLDENDQLQGDFWSRDTWHETWQAVRDDTASLPDPFGMTKVTNTSATFNFSFPDLEGNLVDQEDPRFKGKPHLVVVFGSWCPNCNDEAPFLQDLYQQYQPRGLEILGLAYEMTGKVDRDVRVLKRFQKRHKVTYPILLAGTKDKKAAGATLPDINHVLAFPTTLFIDRNGKVVDIHTGFTGPGTGQRFETLKAEFHEKIQALL